MTTTRREALAAMGLAAAGGWVALTSDPVWAATEDIPMEDSTRMRPYSLPPLPYAYDALEPHIDEKTVRLHHDKHHLGYVKGLNRALNSVAQASSQGETGLVKHWSREVAFHGSGHLLHTLYWQSLSPDGGGEPDNKALTSMIKRDFGSYRAFVSHLKAATSSVEGSGWGVLAFEPMGRRLVILQAEKHQNLTQWGCVPLLALDVGEHAYYLQYQNQRGSYVSALMNLVNWDGVAMRLEKALART